MKTIVSMAGLAKRLPMAENTVGAKIRSRGIEPDGVLIRSGHVDTLLFEVERIPKLRVALGKNKPTEASIEA